LAVNFREYVKIIVEDIYIVEMSFKPMKTVLKLLENKLRQWHGAKKIDFLDDKYGKGVYKIITTLK